MCGISGIYTFKGQADQHQKALESATSSLAKRGPDNQSTFIHEKVGLGHARLSIIDTTSGANQPFSDPSGRYTIVFNGEIYNYQELRKGLQQKGYSFRTDSDTEVLLYAFIDQKEKCLDELNGFYGFAVYDQESGDVFIARDRIGIKPLYIFQNEDFFAFGSEMKAITAYPFERKMSQEALMFYLQLCYIPEPYTILERVQKLKAGHYCWIKNNQVEIKRHYSIPFGSGAISLTNDTKNIEKTFYDMMHEAVEKRLVADVPLGAFLSGGVDSSIIVACARKMKKDLNTFSIGYKDEPIYDETEHAELVAKHFGTNHTTFKLSNDDLFGSLETLLSYVDEPFADSSALAVNILCEHTRKKATVALSGDGGDELFAGYNKHRAEWLIRNPSLTSFAAQKLGGLSQFMPQSRSSKWGNKFRQMNKFHEIGKLNSTDRYWKLASFAGFEESQNLMRNGLTKEAFDQLRASVITKCNGKDFNEFLRNDMEIVLVNDMLVKVDRMSMNHSLEVRVPFLDTNIVDFAFQLNAKYKIDGQSQKKILKDAFSHEIPESIFNRQKHGFEVPLLKWFQGPLKEKIASHWLHPDKIEHQGVFNPIEVKNIIEKVNSNNPGDSPLDIWKLIVFQEFYEKYMTNA